MHVETHFVRFEGKLNPVDVEFKSMLLAREVLEGISKTMRIEEWTITDFDGKLKGNPVTKF